MFQILGCIDASFCSWNRSVFRLRSSLRPLALRSTWTPWTSTTLWTRPSRWSPSQTRTRTATWSWRRFCATASTSPAASWWTTPGTCTRSSEGPPPPSSHFRDKNRTGGAHPAGVHFFTANSRYWTSPKHQSQFSLHVCESLVYLCCGIITHYRAPITLYIIQFLAESFTDELSNVTVPMETTSWKHSCPVCHLELMLLH